jgi:hypothetical protein
MNPQPPNVSPTHTKNWVCRSPRLQYTRAFSSANLKVSPSLYNHGDNRILLSVIELLLPCGSHESATEVKEVLKLIYSSAAMFCSTHAISDSVWIYSSTKYLPTYGCFSDNYSVAKMTLWYYLIMLSCRLLALGGRQLLLDITLKHDETLCHTQDQDFKVNVIIRAVRESRTAHNYIMHQAILEQVRRTVWHNEFLLSEQLW